MAQIPRLFKSPASRTPWNTPEPTPPKPPEPGSEGFGGANLLPDVAPQAETDIFTQEDREILAALIYKRWRWQKAHAAAAWRRLMQNSCLETDFLELAARAVPHVCAGRHRVAS